MIIRTLLFKNPTKLLKITLSLLAVVWMGETPATPLATCSHTTKITTSQCKTSLMIQSGAGACVDVKACFVSGDYGTCYTASTHYTLYCTLPEYPVQRLPKFMCFPNEWVNKSEYIWACKPGAPPEHRVPTHKSV